MLAPAELDDAAAAGWAEPPGDGQVIWLSSGDTLVQVSENFAAVAMTNFALITSLQGGQQDGHDRAPGRETG